jgi:hypothetical protein
MCGFKGLLDNTHMLVRLPLLSSMQRSWWDNLLLCSPSDRLMLAMERSAVKREMPPVWVPWVERSCSRVRPVHGKQQQGTSRKLITKGALHAVC